MFNSGLDSSLNVPLIPQTTIRPTSPSVKSHFATDKHRLVLLPASQRALQKPSMPFFSGCQIPEEVWSLLISASVCECVRVPAESMEWTSCAFLCLHWNNILLINTSTCRWCWDTVYLHEHTLACISHRTRVWEYSYRAAHNALFPHL